MVRVRYWMGRQSEAILYSGGDLLRAATITEAGEGVYKEYSTRTAIQALRCLPRALQQSRFSSHRYH